MPIAWGSFRLKLLPDVLFPVRKNDGLCLHDVLNFNGQLVYSGGILHKAFFQLLSKTQFQPMSFQQKATEDK